MKKYKMEFKEEIAEALTKTIEHETGKKIFTLRITGESESHLETLVVFEDKAILEGQFTIMHIDGQIACRIQGNYI